MPFRVALVLSALVVSAAGTAWPAPSHAQPSTSPRPAAQVSQASVDAGGAAVEVPQGGDSGNKITTGFQGFRPATAPKGPSFLGGKHSKPNAQSGSTRTPATSTALATPKVAVYNNLNSPGMSAMLNGSSEETPPDSTGAIGPNDYVEINNSNIAVWDRTNLSNIAEASLITFTGAPSGFPFCDPQVQWDQSAGRWLFSFLYCNIYDTQQGYFLGWSKTSDPSNLLANNTIGHPGTGGWCLFTILTDSNIFDFVKLGHNARYMIFGGNFYRENPPGNQSPPFITSQIDWVPLPANGDTSCTAPPGFQFSAQAPLKDGDGSTIAFTPVPVNTMTSATDGYIVSAYDPSGSNGQAAGAKSKLAIWRLDNNGVLHQHPDIPVNTYNFPSSAPQSASSNTIDTLDGRLTQAVGDPTSGIWTQHTVDGPGGRSVADWYEIKVSGGVASLAQAGEVSSKTDFVFNAAISPQSSGAGGAAIFYNRSSASHYVLIAAEIRHASTPLGTMEPNETVLVTSTASDHDISCNSPPGAPCRWGDYSGASPDPIVSDAVWGTNMYIVPFGGAPTEPDWDDQNFAVQLVASAPLAPETVTATAGNTYAGVRWSDSLADSLAPVTSYTVNAYQGVSFIGSVSVPASSHTTIFGGLTNGVTYTFTVTGQSGAGPSSESLHSNPVTPTRAVVAASPTAPPNRVVNPAPTPSALPTR